MAASPNSNVHRRDPQWQLNVDSRRRLNASNAPLR